MMPRDLALTPVDELGLLLAQIADLNKRAEAIKDSLKETASSGGPHSFDGAMYRAAYVEANRSTVDYKALLAELKVGSELIQRYTKTTAVFSVKVTAR